MQNIQKDKIGIIVDHNRSYEKTHETKRSNMLHKKLYKAIQKDIL